MSHLPAEHGYRKGYVILPAVALMRRLLVALIVIPLGLAGCFSAAKDPVDANAATNGTLTIDANRPEPTFNDIPAADLGFVAPPDVTATLLAAPQLQEGEWWRIELTDAFTGKSSQFVRVVAAVEDDLYVMGMPHEGWWKEAVIFHSPGLGDVNKDLSHRAHDFPFVPLQFPLEDGKTWETQWESEAIVTAAVTVESPTEARITFTGQNCGVPGLFGLCPNPTEGVVAELVYDATMHEVRSANFPGTHSWRVIEHGYGFQGWVTVPRAEDLTFFHGRIGAPVVDLFQAGAPVKAPMDTVNIEGGYNRVSFILGVGNALPPGDGGAYRETATAPDGTQYVLESIPGAPFRLEFFEHANPDGEWNLEHLAAGPGYAFIEGIAYHQYDIQLPSGDIRSDHSHEVVR